MNASTLRTLLLLCVFLDLLLIGVVLYDYFKNNSDWIVYVLGAFAVFVLTTAILFATAVSSRQRTQVVVLKEPTPASQPATTATTTNVYGGFPAIPPAPVNRPAITTPGTVRLSSKTPPPKQAEGPFQFNGYTLHTRQVELANAGGKRAIYFFSKKKPKSGRPCAKPAGYHVGVNKRTGLPFLKRGEGPDGENLTPTATKTYQAQCGALTADGKQCRNSSRDGSKYASHFGYQPPVISKKAVNRKDTKARFRRAPDTKPAARKSWFGRFRRASA
jgi:hypothetical protein